MFRQRLSHKGVKAYASTLIGIMGRKSLALIDWGSRCLPTRKEIQFVCAVSLYVAETPKASIKTQEPPLPIIPSGIVMYSWICSLLCLRAVCRFWQWCFARHGPIRRVHIYDARGIWELKQRKKKHRMKTKEVIISSSFVTAPRQSSPSLTIQVHLCFIIISLVFAYLGKRLFSGFL